MADATEDLVVAARAHVDLGGLVRLHPSHLDDPEPPSHKPIAHPSTAHSQQADDGKHGGGHQHVVGRLGDELAIRVEAHRHQYRADSVETIEVARASGIVTITLNRPAKKNAANAQMWDELLETFRADRLERRRSGAGDHRRRRRLLRRRRSDW